MLIDEIFSTWLEQDPDFDNEDKARAILRLDQRQTALSNWLYNNLPLDEYLDVLNDQNIDAYDYLEVVEDNINFVISNKIMLEETEFLTQNF